MAIHQRRRFQLLWPVALCLATCAFSSGCGGRKPVVHRVGILSGLDFFAATTDGFKAKMAELGYVEGTNILYDVQKTNFDPAAEERILKQFVADRVDLILTFPTEVSLAAKAVTQGTGIPVVFSNAYVEGVGLIDSVRRPGGNITGVRYPGPDLALKRFDIMRELAPQAKRMWVPYQRGYPIVASQLDVLHPAAASVGVTLEEAPADNAAEVQALLEQRAQSSDIGMDAIFIIAEPLCVTPGVFDVIGRFAAEHRLPVGGAAMISAGGHESLFGVSTESLAVGRQAAVLADKVLRGIPAGTIPVVSAEPYFQLNYRAIKKLGLTVSDGLLSRANEVIR